MIAEGTDKLSDVRTHDASPHPQRAKVSVDAGILEKRGIQVGGGMLTEGDGSEGATDAHDFKIDADYKIIGDDDPLKCPPSEIPLVGDPQIRALPFQSQHWEDFERLVLDLASDVDCLIEAFRYGVGGQRQAGLDVAGRSETWTAYQAKKVEKFTDRHLARALDEFINGRQPFGAARLVVVTACATPTQMRDTLAEYREKHADLAFELWDADHLNGLLRSRPTIVARFFGEHVARRFCDAHALAEWNIPEGLVRRAAVTRAAIGHPVYACTDPYLLDVHEAIHVPGNDDASLLPTYVQREHDAELRLVLGGVLAGQSKLAVLIGGSSTGKTRACWELVQTLPPDWLLWHPTNSGRAEAAAESLEAIGPRTVVWLDELQHYLPTKDPVLAEQVASGIRNLLVDHDRGPVLVLGTIWPEHWDNLTIGPRATEDRPQTIKLLSGCGIHVPETFDADALDNLRRFAHSDPRLQAALDQAEEGHVTQFLSGAPEQLQRCVGASAPARAVLHAAMDARRLGHELGLSAAFLANAAPGYLTRLQWDALPEDWFERAIGYLSHPCRGARGVLSRIRPLPGDLVPERGQERYRLADYIEQHGRSLRRLECPPEGFWLAAAEHAASGADMSSLAVAAYDRGRLSDSDLLAQAAARRGHVGGVHALARKFEESSKIEDAIPYLKQAAAMGDINSMARLAWRHELAGDMDEAGLLYLRTAEAGDINGLVGLASVLDHSGCDEEAERLYRQACATGWSGARAVEYQARHLAKQGQHQRALKLTEMAFQAGNEEAFTGLAWTYPDHQDRLRIFDHALRLGDKAALREIALLYKMDGDYERAEDYAKQAVAAGDVHVLKSLGKISKARGDRKNAELHWRRAVAAGRTDALLDLAGMWEEDGDLEGAKALLWNAWQAGEVFVLGKLVQLIASAGDVEQAERLAGSALEKRGDSIPLSELAKHHERSKDYERAQALLMRAVDFGELSCLLHIARTHERSGDMQAAAKAAETALSAGVRGAEREVVRLREKVKGVAKAY
ncbi:tetratricopeptide repeat protein [Nonomuraea sp. NPDC000554]|uniref:tetratricopeptide repeat protein n=1 Tax=Nonomuraea sp. NPDC000554 TaxID=3154259 RepID=UPI003322ED4C